MNRVNKLYKKYSASKEKDSKVKKTRFISVRTLIWLIFVLVSTAFILYMPLKYSTIRNNSIVKRLTDAITGEQGGIVASNIEQEVEGYDYKVKSSQDFIMEQGDKQLNILKRCKELGILKTNVNIDDLWAIYYAYYSDDYNANLGLYMQLIAWFSDLQKEDNTGFEHYCLGDNCAFITELEDIVALDRNALIKSNAHSTYHRQINESMAELQLTEEDLQQVYEAYILTNPEYVESMTINFTLLNIDVCDKNEALANYILNSNAKYINLLFGNVKYSTTLDKTQVAEAMKYIDFTADSSIINDEILPLVPNAVRSYGISNGLSTESTTIINITGVEDVEEWLKQNNSKTPLKSVSTDTQFIDCGYAKLHWDIKNIDYVDNIPTLEELRQDTEWKNDMYFRLIEQAVWQKFYTGE